MINKKSDKIIIFSDGASKGNPGPGGYGVIVIKLKVNTAESKISNKEGEIKELGGREEHTTNNRMELMGVIKALEFINQGLPSVKDEIDFYTDSKYVIGGMTEWLANWQKNNWRTKAKKDVLNRDLWEKLVDLTEGKTIAWQYVAGHSGHSGNERCDEIASNLALGEKVDLYHGPLTGYKIDIFKLN